MKKLLLLAFAFLSISAAIQAQEFLCPWAKSLGSGVNQDFVNDIALDDAGNIYVTGSFQGTVEFNPGGTTSFSRTSAGSFDGYIAKYTSDGNCQWVSTISGNAVNVGVTIEVDANGIYVAGRFQETTDFNPDPGFESNLVSIGGTDIFYGKYDFNGNLVWVNAHGTINDDFITNIDVSADGDVYIAAYFLGDIDINPSNEITDIRSSVNGSYDVLLTKVFGADGTFRWANVAGSINNEFTAALKVLDNGQILLGGGFAGSTDFDLNGNSTGNLELNNPGKINFDGFIVKYDIGGAYQWGTVLGSASNDTYVDDLDVDDSGNLYVAGTAKSSVDFDLTSGTYDLTSGYATSMYLAKYDLSSGMPGFPLWVNCFGNGGDLNIQSVRANDDQVVIAGYFYETSSLDLDPSEYANYLTSEGGYDAFIGSFDPGQGSLLYAESFGSTSTAGEELMVSLKIDDDNNLYVGGYYENTVAINNGVALSSLGSLDGFFLKLDLQPAIQPSYQPTNFTTSAITTSSYTISFTPASDLPDGYIAVYANGSFPEDAPEDGVKYSIGTMLGNGYVGYVGRTSQFSVTGVDPDTETFYEIYSYNGIGSTIKYYRTDPLVGKVSTTLPTGWQYRTDTNTPRHLAVAGSINGKLYVVGGSTGSGSTTSLEEFDPATNQWVYKTSSNYSRSSAKGAVINNKLYVVGGCLGSDCGTGTTNILEVYDPATDSWTQKASMQVARHQMTIGVVGDKMIVAGGIIACGSPPCNERTNHVEMYDPVLDTWTTLAVMPDVRCCGSGGVIKEKFFVAGGSDAFNAELNGVYEYDFINNYWITSSYPMPTPRQGTSAEVINGKLYVLGSSNTNYINTMEAYDPSLPGWTIEEPMGTGRYTPATAVLNNQLFVVGSDYATASTVVESYSTGEVLATQPEYAPINFNFTSVTANTATIQFTPAYYYPQGYIALRKTGIPFDFAVELEDRRIYAVGSEVSSGIVVAYIGSSTTFTETDLDPGTHYYYQIMSFNGSGRSINYLTAPLQGDFITNKWATLAPLPTARGFSAMQAFDGKIYLIGGSPVTMGQNVAVYDPVTNTWDENSKAPMITNRSQMRAVEIDGKIYVAGGCVNGDCNNATTGVLEVYDPVNNSWESKQSMNTARNNFTAGVIDGKLYVAGGMQGCCSHLSSVEMYDPALDSWTSVMALPRTICCSDGGAIDGKLYVAGGSDGVGLNTLYEYDPESNFWSMKANLPTARYLHGTGIINDQLWVVGGLDNGVPLTVFESYDPLTNSWTYPLEPIPTPRYMPATAVWKNVLYVAGSNADSTPGTAFEAYTTGLANEPLYPAEGFSFITSEGTSTSVRISFGPAAGSPDGYVIIREANSSPEFPFADGVSYAVGDSFEGSVIIYQGEDTTFVDTGLTPNTNYYYRVFVYDGSETTINYLTSMWLDGFYTTPNVVPAPEPEHQPTLLTFPVILASSFNFSFSPSEGAADGYIGIIRTDSSPTFVPQDGATYEPDQIVGDGEMVFLVGTETTGTVENTSPLTQYYIDIFAYNGSNHTINYRTSEGPLENNVTTLSDDDPSVPVIMSNATVSFAQPNTSVNVSAVFEDPESGIALAQIYYGTTESIDNVNDFTGPVTMANSGGNTYTFTIPQSFMSGMGVTYFFYIENGVGGFKISDQYSVSTSLTGEGLEIPFNHFGNDQNDYRIISVPVKTNSGGNLTVASVLSDDLDDLDTEKWRIFHYQSGNNMELQSSSALQVGKGYWLIVRNASDIFTGAGVITAASLNNPFTINLTSGWNQIGNPYLHDIDWADVMEWNNFPAINSARVYEGGWNNLTTLKRFSGAFIFASQNMTLEIPVFNSLGGRKRKPEAGLQTPIDHVSWEVGIALKSGDLVYNFAGIGMHPEASPELDRFDDINLPRFVDYVEMRHNKSFMKYALSRDVIPTSENHIWEFTVETNAESDLVEFTWDNSYFGDNDLQLVLWDVSQNIPVNMRSQNGYSFSRKRAGLFRIVFGKPDFVKQHTLANSLQLYQAVPNPSEGQITFSFSVPESSTLKSQPVLLEVYDLIGRKISTVLDRELEPGHYTAVWNGMNDQLSRPPSGVYLTQLKSANTTDVLRIILK